MLSENLVHESTDMKLSSHNHPSLHPACAPDLPTYLVEPLS